MSKSQDPTGITFVNYVIGRGIVHNVINLTFGAYNFSPNDTDTTIELDPVIACRLRMDRSCFSQLRDACNQLWEQIQVEERNAALAAQMEAAEQVESIIPKRIRSDKIN